MRVVDNEKLALGKASGYELLIIEQLFDDYYGTQSFIIWWLLVILLFVAVGIALIAGGATRRKEAIAEAFMREGAVIVIATRMKKKVLEAATDELGSCRLSPWRSSELGGMWIAFGRRQLGKDRRKKDIPMSR